MIGGGWCKRTWLVMVGVTNVVGGGGCKRRWLVITGVSEGSLSAMHVVLSRGLRGTLVTIGCKLFETVIYR